MGTRTVSLGKETADVNTWLTVCPAIVRRQQGQGLVEYSLSLLFIAVALILAVTVYGHGVNGLYNSILSSMPAGF